MFPGASADESDGSYAIVGAGMERTTSGRAGARAGPSAIRNAGTHFEDYDQSTETRFSTLGVVDRGDIGTAADIEADLDVLRVELAQVCELGMVPITLGGEHTITLAAVRALEPDVIVSLDAHLDLRDDYSGASIHHSTVMRRTLDHVEELVVVGARSGAEPEWARAEADDVTVIEPENATAWMPPANRSVYVSLDIDVADPGVAPATGTPVPGGLMPRELRDLVSLLAPDAVGFDIVEVTDRDDGQTATLAASLLRRFIHDHAQSHQ